ncbi:hypothetical protein O3P69_010154 [Scylla paramamosain]|uniref:Uncharacterized protein n=1 Tax=Scylla paramamosain TaxID=85552 RepID=A0AAW0TS01_SCYPA
MGGEEGRGGRSLGQLVRSWQRKCCQQSTTMQRRRLVMLDLVGMRLPRPITNGKHSAGMWTGFMALHIECTATEENLECWSAAEPGALAWSHLGVEKM